MTASGRSAARAQHTLDAIDQVVAEASGTLREVRAAAVVDLAGVTHALRDLPVLADTIAAAVGQPSGPPAPASRRRWGFIRVRRRG